MNNIIINNREIGINNPTYFVADIAANHDGEIERAFKLCRLAKESGADAVKFQHFAAKEFVSSKGFSEIKNESHQVKWRKTVYDIYQDASLPLSWTSYIEEYCRTIGITFFSSPYGLNMVRHLQHCVPAWKIGSGDINYHEQLRAVAETGLPVMIATGASQIEEVIEAVSILRESTDKIVLMQCNTNYTAEPENYKFINLNVLKTYNALFPELVLGLSDHTFGHETVLGAIALGARVIEKHFTDDNAREGPDHLFSMNPATWREMVSSARLLESAMGSPIKSVCDNEKKAVIVQRRALRATRDLLVGTILDEGMFVPMRPADSYAADINCNFVGKKIARKITKGSCLMKRDLN
jgi:N-acetylneuraminate synthase